MSRLGRFTQKIFGSTATLGQIKKFGSLAAAAPANALSPADVQQLAQYLGGLYAGIIGPKNPAIEDLNGLFYMLTYQLGYALQAGVPEYDAATEYFVGSIVQNTVLSFSGNPFICRRYLSIKAANTGNPLSDPSSWYLLPNGLNPQVSTSLSARAVSAWLGSASIAVNNWNGVCYSPELGKFVAVAGSGANRSSVSTDGKTWVSHAMSDDGSPWAAACWSPELGLFCAVSGALSAAASINTSPDGVTWTSRTAPSTAGWNSICWCPDLGLFVAVDNGGAGKTMHSPDGITWTQSLSGILGTWNSVAWSPYLQLFVAVGAVGGGAYPVMTSPDGIAWTGQAAINNTWRSVCWSPELFQFLATSQDGANRVMYSYDGINWNGVAVPTAEQWVSVCWSSELGQYVAVSNTGANQLIYSPDGINWTNIFVPSATWTGVCWAPQKGIFVSVGSTGVSQSMTSRYVQKLIA